MRAASRKGRTSNIAGLLIKQPMIWGDLERCLIISPRSLTERSQDQLSEKFGLQFELPTREMITAAHTGELLRSKNLRIVRLGRLNRRLPFQPCPPARLQDPSMGTVPLVSVAVPVQVPEQAHCASSGSHAPVNETPIIPV